jgi:hypothetical protein
MVESLATRHELANAHTVMPTEDEPNEAYAVCSLIDQVHPSLVWITCNIFASAHDKRVKRGGTLFLAHLLRFASIVQFSFFADTELSDFAKISIPNIAAICASRAKKAHSGWPWCYDTTTKYLKLLIAAGILITRNDEPGIYYLPLNEYTLLPEYADQHIEQLASARPKVSKSAAFRRATIHCTLQGTPLSLSPEETMVDFPKSETFMVDFDAAQRTLKKISTVIRRSQHITLSPQAEVDLLHILKEDLPHLLKKNDGRFFKSQEQGKNRCFPKMESGSASKGHLVDASYESPNKGYIVDTLQTNETDHYKAEMLIQSPKISCEAELVFHEEGENLLCNLSSLPQPPKAEPSVKAEWTKCQEEKESEIQLPRKLQEIQSKPNLLTPKHTEYKQSGKSTINEMNLLKTVEVVDSASPIDIDNSNINIISHSERIDIDSQKLPIVPTDICQLNVHEARQLADFVEQKPGNFPNFISLSKQFSPVVIRAAVVNMVVHTIFPDETGTLTGEQDGVLTKAWGRPSNPGKWVWASCRAYQQQGVPAVMNWLLKRYEGRSYREIQHDLHALERRMTPRQFWAVAGQRLCQADAENVLEEVQEAQKNDAANTPREVQEKGYLEELTLPVGVEAGHYTPHGMSSWEALQLVKRIEDDGRIHQIVAQAEPLPGGRYQVVMHQTIRGRSIRIPKAMVCNEDWTKYIGDLRYVLALKIK